MKPQVCPPLTKQQLLRAMALRHLNDLKTEKYLKERAK